MNSRELFIAAYVTSSLLASACGTSSKDGSSPGAGGATEIGGSGAVATAGNTAGGPSNTTGGAGGLLGAGGSGARAAAGGGGGRGPASGADASTVPLGSCEVHGTAAPPVAIELSAVAPAGLVPQAGAAYWVQAKLGGKRLAIDGDLATDGSHLVAQASDGQAFTFAPAEAGYYFIRARGARTLNVPGSTTADCVQIQQWEGNWDENRWRLEPMTDGYVRIVNKLTMKCLQADYGAAADTMPVVQNQCSDSGAQRWAVRSTKLGQGGADNQLAMMQPGWNYTWGTDPAKVEPKRTEFIPMIWGYWGDFAGLQKQCTDLKGTSSALLGFNEPDGTDQANMTVASAIAAWPALQLSEMRLGSPAGVHADGQWVQDFMTQARAKNYRVDFITVHWYGGADVNGLLGHLKTVHELYKLPIWITEFAPADWSATATKPNMYSPEAVQAFLRGILPALEALDYVQRYAWFSFAADSPAGGSSALYAKDGSLTKLGQMYRDFPHAR